jgi:MarR family transcriptional repressor of emrRAB
LNYLPPTGSALVPRPAPDTPRASAPPARLSDQARHTADEFSGVDSLSILTVLAMYRAFAVLDRHQSREIAESGLNTTQWNALMVLHRAEGPLTMGELGQRLAVRPTNLSGIAGALVKRGLVRRVPGTTDRRLLEASLTPAGERFIERLLPGHYRRMEAVMSRVPDRDRRALVRSLARLVQVIEETDQAADSDL